MRLLGRVTGLTPAVPGQFCREADGLEGGERGERVRWVVIVERGPARVEVEQWSSVVGGARHQCFINGGPSFSRAHLEAGSTSPANGGPYIARWDWSIHSYSCLVICFVGETTRDGVARLPGLQERVALLFPRISNGPRRYIDVGTATRRPI